MILLKNFMNVQRLFHRLSSRKLPRWLWTNYSQDLDFLNAISDKVLSTASENSSYTFSGKTFRFFLKLFFQGFSAMKLFNHNRNYNRRTNTHNLLRRDYQIRNASSFKKYERRGENVESKDFTCVTVIFTLKVIIDWNVPSRKLLVPFEVHDFTIN